MALWQRRTDYHIHTKYSHDSRTEPAAILREARRKGLATIAVTDHDTIRGGLEVAQINDTELEVIVGAEIFTDRGEVIGLGLTDEIRSRALADVVKEIKDQGGRVYVPHPFDRFRQRTALAEALDKIADEVDFIEGFNGRCLWPSFNREAIKWAQEHDIPLLQGSDAHFAYEIGNVRPSFGGFLESSSGFVTTKLLKIAGGVDKPHAP